MDAIIKLENISLWYNKDQPIAVQALKNISLEIERGDYVAFFGPSGCGKTTMLYAISGIDRFQEGKIVINDRDISAFTNQELAIFRQTGIGIIFQQFNLVPSLTVLKNVSLPMLFIGITSEKADIEARKLLERLKLTEFADRYPYELSGGQQQRVGIARALANDPPIIIADEPLGNLDSVNAKNVLEFLKELNEKDGRTIIMVTHEAWSLRDVKTIFHMKDGTVVETEHMTNKVLSESIAEHLNKQLSSISGEKLPDKDTPEVVSAFVVASFLLRGYSNDEINRLSLIISDVFSNKINMSDFHKAISKPYKDGGVGLWKKKSKQVSKYLEDIIKMHQDLDSLIKTIEKNPEISIFDEIKDIRGWLIEGYAGKLIPGQITSLDQVISDRIRNYISPEQVVELLDLSKNKFGVGLSFRAAHLMSEKLELILNDENFGEKK